MVRNPLQLWQGNGNLAVKVDRAEKAAKRLKREMGARSMREWYRWVYLKSPHWSKLRASKLKEQPLCKCRREATQVHHVNYRSIYDVTLADLLSICYECHLKAHGLRDTKPPYWRRVIGLKRASRIARKTWNKAEAEKAIKRWTAQIQHERKRNIRYLSKAQYEDLKQRQLNNLSAKIEQNTISPCPASMPCASGLASSPAFPC